jgi:undecaprenyl-diphosphatase
MLAATGYDLLKEVHPGKAALAAGQAAAHVSMTGERWIVLAIGFVISFIVAFAVVEWFLMWVRRHGFVVFAVYRIILGLLLLFWGARILAA